MKKPPIVYPFLFAIFPVLFLFWHNMDRAPFSGTLLPLAVTLGFTLFLLSLLSLMFGDIKKAGVLTSLFLILFFSYGHIFNVIQGWRIGNFIIGRYRYLAVAWGMLFTSGSYFTIRTRRDLHNFTNILNIVAFFLVAISLINIGAYTFKTKSAWHYNIGSAEDEKTNIIDLGNRVALRDIYYIILDGYAASSTLRESYNYDNHEFTDHLAEKGFYIATKSRSNYANTIVSLASFLNMEHINYLTDLVGVKPVNRAVLFQLAKDNKVIKFLKSKGYKIIHFRSIYEPTDYNRYADLNIQCGRFNEFQITLIQTTMLAVFNPSSLDFVRADQRKRMLGIFAKLAEIHKIKGPKFVFAHIVAPHSPYLFNAEGKPVTVGIFDVDTDSWQQDKNYLNQLIFVNRKVEELIDKILSTSDTLPIIILQADHGAYRSFPEADARRGDLPNENTLREIMRIFNVYYLPSGGSDLLYDSITPVNTFRLIFNFYFGANYELLDDQSYFSTYRYLYRFINVTDKTKYD